jgi:hypothetical protein
MTRRILLTLVSLLPAFAADEIAGKWNLVLDTDGGQRNAVLTIAVDGENVTGKWETTDVKGTFKEGKLELDFPLTSPEAGFTANLKISAKLSDGGLTGNWSYGSYAGALKGKKA